MGDVARQLEVLALVLADGLLARGRRVSFVEEAARGLDEVRTAACTAAWREAGVMFVTLDEAVSALSRSTSLPMGAV